MKCVNLLSEYQINPIGIDVAKPRLSWRIEGDKTEVMQRAYTIQCSSDEKFKNIICDSGKVKSDKSNNVECEGLAFSPMQRVYWRVMADTTAGETPYSNPAYFETGLMDSGWKGSFICPNKEFKAEQTCPVLKKKFTLKETPAKARLYITSLGMYEAHINSEMVDQDVLAPGWTSYSKHLQYQTYDVTSQLTGGENIISVLLGSGWYMSRLAWEDAKNHYGDSGALLAQLEVIYDDGTTQTIVTDDTWKSGESAILFSEIYDGEKYDARKGCGMGGEDYDKLKGVKLHKIQEKSHIVGQNTPGVRKVDEIAPIEIITTPKGDTVLDFGQNMVGWVEVTAKGNAGDEVHIIHGEIMLDEEFYHINMRSAKTEATYFLSGEGVETFRPHFTFFGFRYVKVAKYPGEVKLENFKGIVLSSDLHYGGTFKCSNKKVNKLFENMIWGQKGNFVDVPTDCPQRDERLGWTGDTQVFSATACYNSIAPTFYEKWLKDVAHDQTEEGGVPSVIPDILHDGIASSAWGDASVIVPYTLYEIYEGVRVLDTQYPSMKKWVEYIHARSRGGLIWETDFHFGDWLAKDGYGATEIHGATPIPIIATALYYYSTTLLSKTAKAIGKQREADDYAILARNIKEAFCEEFVTASGRISGETQTAYTLALHFDMLNENMRTAAARHLAELVRKQGHRITTGFVGTPYITFVLSRFGYNEDAYKMLLNEECPGWLYPVNMGATTIWERWDSLLPDGSINSGSMNSFNHYAYGSIAHWMYAVVLGIKPGKGFKSFEIAPKPCGLLNHAEGGIDTLYGRVESAWKLKDGKITLKFTIPANTEAKVCLPYAMHGDVSLYPDGEDSAEGLIITLGSGRHEISYTNDKVRAL
jgi:alpha-L-rhamnosidase